LDSKTKYLDMSGKAVDSNNDWSAQFSSLSLKDKTARIIAEAKYLTYKDGAATTPLTLWIAADVDSVEGRLLFRQALESLVCLIFHKYTFYLFSFSGIYRLRPHCIDPQCEKFG
jgi:hypothetical protein